MLKFISVGFWTLLGPSRGLFKTTLLWSLTFFDGFLGPLCCHLWPFLTVFGANFMPKKGLLLEGFGSKLCGDPEPNFEESKQDYWFVKKWGQPDTNSSRHDMTFHVNGEKNHCNGWSLTSIFWAAIAAMNTILCLEISCRQRLCKMLIPLRRAKTASIPSQKESGLFSQYHPPGKMVIIALPKIILRFQMKDNEWYKTCGKCKKNSSLDTVDATFTWPLPPRKWTYLHKICVSISNKGNTKCFIWNKQNNQTSILSTS